MRITVLVEGQTEIAFKPHLRAFLTSKLAGRMPRLDFYPFDGRIPTGQKLRRIVESLLSRAPVADAVIALTDVYTGGQDFVDARDAKAKMSDWVGPNPHFFPHVAQYDFEAWLLPYWDEIQRIAGHNRNAPAGSPETVDHDLPPSHHVREIFRIGTGRVAYSKPRDARRILRGKDLEVAVRQCPELRAFVERIISIAT